MDIRVLQYFLAVVREENITKAAQLLHITQPTLSRQLMGLEQELGVKLFSRNNHSVTLTEEGMLFRRRAEEIVTQRRVPRLLPSFRHSGGVSRRAPERDVQHL